MQLWILEPVAMANVHSGATYTPPPSWAAQPIILPPVMMNVPLLELGGEYTLVWFIN